MNDAAARTGAPPLHAVVKPCGSCSLCCKVMAITSLAKASGSWCRHFAKGVGCAVHAEKPGECRHFQCYWSVSEVLGDEWKPDRSRLVLWSDAEGRVMVEVDGAHPFAWRQAPYYATLKSWSDWNRPRPLQVLVRVNGRMIVVFPEAEIDLGPQQPGMQVDSGYRQEGGRNVPYAAYVLPG